MKTFFFAVCMGLLTLLPAGAEDLLYFCGGRLFGSGKQKNVLTLSGCKVKLVDTRQLAGFGGSIRKYEDKEPEKTDGITPEFRRLDQYRAVVFGSLPPRDLEGILTAERVRSLREYIQNGGTFIADIRTPGSLGDILPVTFKGNPRKPKNVFCTRPDIPELRELPEKWRKLTPYRFAKVLPGSTVNANITDASGKVIAPAIVIRHLGKGRVIFVNGILDYSSSATGFTAWGYSKYFTRGLVSHAAGIPLKNRLYRAGEPSDLPPLEKAELAFREYRSELKTGGTVTLQGDTALFSSGMKIRITEDGSAEVSYPGVKEAFRWAAPVFKTAGNPQSLNGDNNEAIVNKYDLMDFQVKWDSIRYAVNGSRLAVTFSTPDAQLVWEFLPVELELDGRKYIGYGDRVVVKKLPVFLESVELDGIIPNGKIRRNTCYTSPRGYLETVLGTGKGEIADSRIWQFFCSGQPFTYLQRENEGIFAEIVDYPIPCFTQFRARQDGKLFHSLRLLAGRRKVPAELPIIWHLYSHGKENGNNDYIAMYQYARRHLRDKCGIKTFPQATQASYYLHKRKPADLEASAKMAARLNFRSVWLSLCPLQMTEIDGKRLAGIMDSVRKEGLIPHPWTAGGYNHRDSSPVFKDHPDWFIRRKDGSFHRYFKILGVADFNNPDFRKWFIQRIDKARANGMERVYHDMGGEISCQVNYYPPNKSGTATLDGLVLLLQEYSKRDLPCSVEGMNPLVKDQALFNPEKAYPLKGKEFAYVGGMPLATVDNGQANALFFDYFRLLMYNATINVDVDGVRMNFERVPGELEAMKRIARWNLLFNKAHTFVEAPFVRETPFGTVWAGKDTAAIFFERGVKNLKLDLPKSWCVAGNASLRDIPDHSMILLKRVK